MAGFLSSSTPARNEAGANPVPANASIPSWGHLPDDISPLGRAAFTGDLETVLVLLGARCNPNWMEKGRAHGYTPLVAAAENGHVEIVEVLLEAGADVNLKNPVAGRTALYAAAQCGHLPVVTLLLRQPKIRFDETSWDRGTPLDCAVVKGHAAVAEALMDVIKVPPARVMNMMHSACRDGRLAIVELLHRRAGIGADQAMSHGCLSAAAANGRDNVVAYLLKAGMAASMTSREREVLLHMACSGKSIAVMDLLLGHADIRNYDVPLCYFASLAGDLPLLEHLVQKGANPNMQHQGDGWNALMHAVVQDRMDMLQMLLACPGLELDLVNRAGLTALQLAMSGDMRDAAMSLLKAGAKVALPAHYMSNTCLLRWAVDRRDGSLFRLVLERCDPDPAQARHLVKEALEHAVKDGCVDIVECLLAATPGAFASTGLIGQVHRASRNNGHAAAIDRALDAQLRLAEGMAAGKADAAKCRYHVDIDGLEHYVDAIVIIDLQLSRKPELESWPLAALPRMSSSQTTPLQVFQELLAPQLAEWDRSMDARENLLKHFQARLLSMAVALPVSDCLGRTSPGLELLASPGRPVNPEQRAIYCAAALSALDPVAQAANAGRLFASANISADAITQLSRTARLQFMALHAIGVQASALLGEEMLEKILPACRQRTDSRHKVDVVGLTAALIQAGLMQPLAQVVAESWKDSVVALMTTPLPLPPGATFFDITQILEKALRQLGHSHFAARLLAGLRQASVLSALRQLISKAETDEALPMLFQIQVDQLRQYGEQLQQN